MFICPIKWGAKELLKVFQQHDSLCASSYLFVSFLFSFAADFSLFIYLSGVLDCLFACLFDSCLLVFAPH